MKKSLLFLIAGTAMLMSSGTSMYGAKSGDASAGPDLKKVETKKAMEKWNTLHCMKSKAQGGNLSASSMFASKSIANPLLRGVEAQQARSFKAAVLYSDLWDEDYPQYGVYGFTAADPVSFSRYYVKTDAPQNGGAFFANGRYYFTSYETDEWGSESYFTTYVVDTNTWKLVTSYDQTEYHMATCLSFDPISGYAYGCFYGGEDIYMWGYMDPNNECGVTQLALLEGELVAVAVNTIGEAYGITNSGYLVKIDKESGELTAIGATGITPAYMQTAVFDETNTLYWAVGFTDGSTGLFTVDTTNGHVARVVAFESQEEIVALDPEPLPEADGVPAQVKNLTLNFPDGVLSGTVTFDVPTVDNKGEALTGVVTYIISVDGVDKYHGTATVGGTESVDVTVESVGNHNIGVRLCNTVGECRALYEVKWIGVGRPLAVTDLTMTKTADMQATITWTAPTESENGNYFDAARLSYTITRLPENVVVAKGIKATQYIDDMSFDGQAYISYKVTVYADDVAGKPTTSNGAVFGSAFVPPVTFDLDSEANFNLFTIIDTNETPSSDSGRWQYSPSGGCAGYNTGTVDGDDWFITPDISLEAGRQYLFSYDVLCYSDYWPDKYAVYMGQGNTIEAMTTELVPPTTIYWDEYRRPVIKVSVETSGVYNFGFHALSEAGGAFFLIDNISVSPSFSLSAPAAATDVKVVAGENGAFNATVTFTAPTLTVEGKELASISEIKVLRDDNVVATLNEVAPGKEYSVKENDMDSGMAQYSIVAVNASGEGEPATGEAWVGIDTPVEPTVSADIVDGHPHITWTAPEGRGANGGYVDTAALKYIVYRPTDDKILAYDTESFEYTDTDVTVPETGEQSVFQYGVYAHSAAGIGNPGSAFVVGGDKYALPFHESFPSGTTDNLWVISSSYGDSWIIDDAWNGSPQDGDNGELMLVPYTPGSESTIFSGKIDMTAAHNPVLTFYVYPMAYDDNGFAETSPEDDRVDVEVAGPDFKFNVVKSFRTMDLEAGKYNLIEIPLDEFVGKDFIQIGFFAHNGGARSPLMLDNISVVNGFDNNLSLKSFELPASADVFSTVTSQVTVYNDGKNTAESYAVSLYRGDELLGTVQCDEPLARYESKTVSFDVTVTAEWRNEETLTANVVSQNDENEADNSMDKVIAVIRPNMPLATDLAAVTDDNDNFTFTWTAPDLEENPNVVESFEGYDHGAYKNVGDWTMIDADEVMGFDDFKVGDDYIDIPHAFSQTAFMVINPAKCGIDLTANPGWMPHSGDRMLVSFCNWELDNDDWVITPRLSGNAQTVSFWAKSGKADSEDAIYVYYSKDGVADEDFSRMDKIQLTDEWTKYEFELPAGANYFAVRNYKKSCYAVLLDDFSFEKLRSEDDTTLEVLGYNLYCEGVKVNSELITDTTYTVADGATGNYAVTVVYNVGESDPSERVYVVRSGVNGIEEDEDMYPTYDLQGRVVRHLENGQVYIHKGRKFVYRVK